MSVITPADLETKITGALTSVLHIEATDLSDGCGGKFHIVCVAEDFRGKPLLAQHRMINKILEEEMKTIHALTMKTMNPDQWEAAKAAEKAEQS
jgi:stress-induced morphogen